MAMERLTAGPASAVFSGGRGLVDLQQDLAAVLAAFHSAMGIGRLRQRIYRVDDGAYLGSDPMPDMLSELPGDQQFP